MKHLQCATEPAALLSRSASINDEFRPSHEGGLIRGQIQDTIGDFFRGGPSALPPAFGGGRPAGGMPAAFGRRDKKKK